MEAGIYLLKVSISLVVLYVPYALFFRRSTLFSFNRYYLLSALLISFAVPQLQYSFSPSDLHIDSYAAVAGTLKSIDDFQMTETTEPFTDGRDFTWYLKLIYFSGAAWVLFRFLISIAHVIRKKNLSRTVHHPFAFFNKVVMPAGEIDPLVLAHEQVHVDQKHWFDLVASAAATVVLWFNPILIAYRRSLRIQHEYLADAGSLKNKVRLQDYLISLMKQLQVESGVEPVSHFYSESIKQRIHMITRKKTARGFSGLYFVGIPLVGILSLAFSLRPSEELVLTQETSIPSLAPVDMKRLIKLSSGFGNRIHPLTKKEAFHTGLDFQLEEGEVVMATADGVVIESITDKMWGVYVVIQHDDTYSTSYSHLRNAIVKKGEKLVMGQTLGYVGNTGWSVGPHLHYEVLVKGKAVDPKDYLPK